MTEQGANHMLRSHVLRASQRLISAVREMKNRRVMMNCKCEEDEEWKCMQDWRRKLL
jgi:hypothetical protein